MSSFINHRYLLHLIYIWIIITRVIRSQQKTKKPKINQDIKMKQKCMRKHKVYQLIHLGIQYPWLHRMLLDRYQQELWIINFDLQLLMKVLLHLTNLLCLIFYRIVCLFLFMLPCSSIHIEENAKNDMFLEWHVWMTQ